MSGRTNYGSMRSEFRDDPFRDPRQLDQQLSKIRNKVSDIRTAVRELEELFFKMNSVGGATRDVRSQILRQENRINETIDATNLLLRNLNNYRVDDRLLKTKVDKIRRDLEATIRKYRDLTQAISEMMKSLSIASPDEGVVVDTGSSGGLLQQDQVNIEADLALQLEQEQEMNRLTGDIEQIEEMFRDLHGQVHEQGESVDSLFNNMEDARTNVEVANQQLASAVVYKRKVRKRCCCITIIVLVVLGIIGLIIGLEVKNK